MSEPILSTSYYIVKASGLVNFEDLAPRRVRDELLDLLQEMCEHRPGVRGADNVGMRYLTVKSQSIHERIDQLVGEFDSERQAGLIILQVTSSENGVTEYLVPDGSHLADLNDLLGPTGSDDYRETCDALDDEFDTQAEHDCVSLLRTLVVEDKHLDDDDLSAIFRKQMTEMGVDRLTVLEWTE